MDEFDLCRTSEGGGVEVLDEESQGGVVGVREGDLLGFGFCETGCEAGFEESGGGYEEMFVDMPGFWLGFVVFGCGSRG
jgi:hypothetical protein